MSLRYRKRIKIFDGFYLNLSKSGISSVSIGKPGLSVNVGKSRSSMSIGIPGTGLSYREYFSKDSKRFSSSSSEIDELLAKSRAVREEAESLLKEYANQKEDLREELDRCLNLNRDMAICSHQEFWNSVEKKILEKYAQTKPLNFSIDSWTNVRLMASAIENHVDGVIYLQNNYVPAPIPFKNLVNLPVTIFGDIYIGSGMTVVDKDLSIIELDLKTLDVTKEDETWAKNYLVATLGGIFILFLFSWLMIFKGSGFLVTLGGIVGLGLSVILLKEAFSLFFSLSPIRNLGLVKAIARKSKIWASEISSEVDSLKYTLGKAKQSAASKDHEKIMESLVFVANELQARSDTQVGAGISDDGILCVLLQLPEKENLEVKNKMTPGGKESVQEKSETDLNKEYATAVLNLSFYLLTKIYSAYPVFNQVRLAGFTHRTSEATGNAEKEIILYFDSKREDFAGINFRDANPIKLAQHLNYRIELEKNYYMNAIDIKDSLVNDLKDEEDLKSAA